MTLLGFGLDKKAYSKAMSTMDSWDSEKLLDDFRGIVREQPTLPGKTLRSTGGFCCIYGSANK